MKKVKPVKKSNAKKFITVPRPPRSGKTPLTPVTTAVIDQAITPHGG